MTSHTVLVVEDNPATRKMVCRALGERGHRVLEAPDGRTALDLMERHQPVLVLQDIILPDFDGFHLAAELRRRGPAGAAILAFSGFTSRDIEARLASVGFDDVIIKPIDPSRLIPLIEARLPASPLLDVRFGAGRRVVVVDDDLVQLKLTRIHLEKLGFVVETAADGREALDLIRGSPPDAVVSDVLMPHLDGFGLALALRQEEQLLKVPLLLLTSSYVDVSDRALARRAGANDLILRTPDQREMVSSLRAILTAPAMPLIIAKAALPEIEEQRSQRAVQQLERHVLMNAGLVRRCSALSAELAVLTGISEALLKHQNIDDALDETLASCFDAGGISVGALYLTNPDGSFRVRPLGSKVSWKAGHLESFFGHQALLASIVAGGAAASLPSPALPAAAVQQVLDQCDASSALIVPLVHSGQPMGALFMVAQADELDRQDWRVFVQTVANQIAQALTLAREFDARAAAEQRALESRAEWRALAENAPDSIVRLDRDGIIRFANRTLPPLALDDVVGTSWLTLIPGEYHEALRTAFDNAIVRGEASSHEIMIPVAGGDVRWYSSRLGPIRADGATTGVVVISRDISEKKQQEAQLIVSDRMASVGTMAAGVAHEINNPLSAVIANLDLSYRAAVAVGQHPGLRDLEEFLRDAQEGAERVRLIVRDLRIFSRSEEDRLAPVDVRLVLESTLRLAWNEIRHRAQLVERFEKVPLVEANEARLGQVFLNLVVNAAQAIPVGNADRNEIRVATRMEPNGRIAVEIADTGTGMPDEVMKRLFTPFFTTKPVGVGTGLGLSICQKIVSAMKGEIRVQSKVGEGSTFTVFLTPAPALEMSSDAKASPAPAPTTPAAPPESPPAPRRGRVMLIDDEPLIAIVVQRTLKRDHDVLAMTDAVQALTLLRSGEPFDVVLCDLMMPQTTGMEIYAELRRSHPDVADKMIFLTGGAFTAKAREFLSNVPNLRIEKPFDVQQLRTLVSERVR